MNRRQLMVTAGAAAIFAIAPVAVVARAYADPGTETAEAIDSVFQIMEEYGFNQIDSQAGLFSYYPGSFQSLNQLNENVRRLAGWGQRDIWGRVDFMLNIRKKLERRFGDDLSAHIAWLDAPHPALYGKTPRQQMNTLHYFDLAQVAQIADD
jgi:hypothetical protein